MLFVKCALQNNWNFNIFYLFCIESKLIDQETFICCSLQIIFIYNRIDGTMTKENDKSDKFESMSFIALIHHISKNKLKYSIKNPNRIDMVHEGRYLIQIYKKENLSQDDLADMFCQSKGTIAKALRKLEDNGYVERKIDENNRRKYILKTTKDGEKLAILLIKDLEEWEKNVGIDRLDDDTKDQLRRIARKSEEILEE